MLLVVLLQAGCSQQAVYVHESFSTDSPFRLKVGDDVALACESARRSLLGQGYLIDASSSEQVKARKSYRIEGKANTFIEMHVACVADSVGSTLYATGVLSTYDLKKSSNPASVGLAGVGSISLPIGQSADSLVKVSEETIGDNQFYRRFFAVVEFTLEEMREQPPAPEEGVTVIAAPDAAAPPLTVDAVEPEAATLPVAVPEPHRSPASTDAQFVESPAPVMPAAEVPVDDAQLPASGVIPDDQAVQEMTLPAPAAGVPQAPSVDDTPRLLQSLPSDAGPEPEPSAVEGPAGTPLQPELPFLP